MLNGTKFFQVKVPFIGIVPTCKKHLALQADVHNIVEKLMQETVDKSIECVANISQQKVVHALETYDVDYDKIFIKATLKSALNGLLVCI